MATQPALDIPASPGTTIVLVRRDELPTLSEVVVDGKVHNLGIHKDFRRHPALAAALPEEGRMSLAWVHLDTGESLAVHQHPIATLVLICEGRGFLVGDRAETLDSGDIIAIPAGCRHGFTGGEGGFWALSVQFEGRGLYEDPTRAQVRFEGDRSSGLVELLRRNASFAKEHTQNAMFDLIRGGHLADSVRRARFLDAVQVWSEVFHRLLLMRSAITQDQRFTALFDRHLAEEYDHATRLAADRGTALTLVWDPELDAAANWFVARMLTLDDTEKVVLIHLVLEVGSLLFSRIASPVFAPYSETDYFAIHADADGAHELMGVTTLDHLDAFAYERLYRVQQQGWDMLNTLCARIAALVLT